MGFFLAAVYSELQFPLALTSALLPGLIRQPLA